VTRKCIITWPILNRFSTFLRHVVQNRKICNFSAGRQSVRLQQKISIYDALFTALMRKSILRATLSHFRYFTICWETFHNSVNFEAIFEIFRNVRRPELF
jgi:hypothetical protein